MSKIAKKDLLAIANSIRKSLDSVDRIQVNEERYAGRGAILRIVDEIWYDLIAFNDENRKHFEDHGNWLNACGFKRIVV